MAEEITKKEDELSCVALAPYLTRSRPGWGLPLSGGKKLGSSLLASARLSSVPPPPPVQWGGGITAGGQGQSVTMGAGVPEELTPRLEAGLAGGPACPGDPGQWPSQCQGYPQDARGHTWTAELFL